MDFLLYIVMSGLLGLLASRVISRIRPVMLLLLMAIPPLLLASSVVGNRVLAPMHIVYQTWPHRAVAEDLGVDDQGGIWSDLVAQMIPWKAASRASWFDGEPPLWNPYMLGGDALAPTVQPAPYEPIFLTSLLLDLGSSLNYIAAMTIFLSLLGMFLLLRDLSLSEVAALVGAIAWALGGFTSFWLQWAIGLSAVFLPLVILGVRLCIRTPALRSALFLTAVFSWMLLAGHSETAIHYVYTGIVWSIAELVVRRPTVRELGRIAFAGAGAGALAILLTAFFLAPIVEVLPATYEYEWRKGGSDVARIVGTETSLYRLSTPVIPYSWGATGWSHTDESPEPPLPDTAYPGSIALMLAFIGLVASRARIRWWVLSLGVGALLVSAELPGIAHVVEKLPGLEIALNDRFDVVTLFSLAILAALGIDALSCTTRKRRAILAAAAALTLGGVALLMYPVVSARGISPLFLNFSTLWYVVPLVLAGVVIALPPRIGLLALASVASLLYVQRSGETGWHHPTATEPQFYPPLPILEMIPDHGEPFRVAGVGDTFLPATSALYGLEDVRGYQALTLARTRGSFYLWSEPQHVWFNRIDDPTRAFLSALNVRYLLAPPGHETPAELEMVHSDESGVLFENPRVLSRAWVPGRVSLNMPLGELVEQMSTHSDFGALAWVEHPSGGSPPAFVTNGPGEVLDVTATSVRRRTITVEMTGPGWVIISEPAWPGWKAFLEGERLSLRHANIMMLAAHLEPGRHEIELVYLPRSFVIGSSVSGLTIVTLLGVVLFRTVRRRSSFS